MPNWISRLGFIITFLATPFYAPAATHTWSGAGATGYWSNTANWTGGAPAAGETPPVILTFPAGAARQTSTNNLTLAIDQLNVSGVNYVLRGSGTGTNLVLRTNSTLVYNLGGTNNLIDASLALTFSNSPTLLVTNSFTLAGPLLGPGGFIKSGTGTLAIAYGGSHLYGGTTIVNAGILTLKNGFLFLGNWLSYPAIPGPLIISNATVRLLAGGQLNSTPTNLLQLQRGGSLDLNNYTQTAPRMQLWDTCTIDSGTNGQLTLSTNLSVDCSAAGQYATLNGRVALGGSNRLFAFNNNTSPSLSSTLTVNAAISDGGAAAGLTLQRGTITLMASNSFSGPLLVANGAKLTARHSSSLGSTNAALVITNNGWVTLLASITNKSLLVTNCTDALLACSQTNVWTGPIQLFSSLALNPYGGTGDLALTGPISGPGGLNISGYGILRLRGTYSGTLVCGSTTVVELGHPNGPALTGTLTVYTNCTIRTTQPNQFGTGSSVNLYAGGLLDFTNGGAQTISWLTGSGTVALGTAGLSVGGSPANFAFAGQFIGSASAYVTKMDTNVLTLTGTNSFPGSFHVQDGYLMMEGSFANATARVSGSGVLRGLGNVGAINSSGKVAPGNIILGSFRTGNFSLGAGGRLTVGLISYLEPDQISVTGTTVLGDGVATLGINPDWPLVSGPGSTFTIITNLGASAVSGHFAGLPEGGGMIATNNGSVYYFQISYHGGDGNDVTLTQIVPTPPQWSGATPLANTLQLTGDGTPGLNYTIFASTNLVDWVSLGNATANGTGRISFSDSQSGNFARRFYRLAWP